MSQKPARRPADQDGKNERQTPRTIRFHDRDWDRIETYALMRGMTTTELIRTTVLAALGEEPGATGFGCPLAPQVERMFPIHTHSGDRHAERDAQGRPRRRAGGAGPLGEGPARQGEQRLYGLS